MDCITQSIKMTSSFKELEVNVRNGKMPVSLSRVNDGAGPYLIKLMQELTGRIFVVSKSDFAARRLYEEYPYKKVFFPSQQTELGIIEVKSNEVNGQRMAAINAIIKGDAAIFLSADALRYKMRPLEKVKAGSFTLSVGDIIAPGELSKRLAKIGYERTAMIEGMGQFSGRGEILEIFVPGKSHPYRISFFDDEIESIKEFDTDSQRSFGQEKKRIEIYPASEIILNEEEITELSAYLKKCKSGRAKEYAQRYIFELNENGYFANLEAFTSVFHDSCTIADYASEAVILTLGLAEIARSCDEADKNSDAMLAASLSEGGAFGCENDCRLKSDEFIQKYADRIVDISDISQSAILNNPLQIDMGIRQSAGFPMFSELVSALKARIHAGGKVYLFAASRAKGLCDSLFDEGIEAPVSSGDLLKTAGIRTLSASIVSGFEIPEINSLFLSETDIFGSQRRKKQKRKREKSNKEFLAELKPGDIIIHEVHGKGRFLGIKNIEMGGINADYVELEYRDGEMLYIKTDQIDRISRYIGPGSDDADIKLSKLGGKEWSNQKAKARASVKKLTEDLVSIYSQREHMQGYSFSPDTVWQSQFENSFEFEETPGQAESIEKIKLDMESGKVMDRLLLGDVGYGKTEVAMRACFKAVMDSKQVAVLVPTTLLARQHFDTFKKRFTGFPVNIALLTRYTKKPKEVLDKLEQGSIDIIIGTHKLLSKSVVFKDLGLLVVDEEQRFGVSHKERIKDMKRSVDVLTLTATPIPRTLEMAMTGIRDMSTIDTPPLGRKEVQAYVVAFSWGLVREAVLKELARGGQVYFVCRRISQMDELMRRLKKNVPEARIGVAHGQMSETEFDRSITAFYEREYDVLLCTTIIESGIDIPSVNTLIVYEADKFGLAQLYQLKGRVGRSTLRAYAYFTHNDEENITELAQKRLSAIRDFTQFGSGMRIAMKDLEIRGAGNILGAEQSGHMAQIGYDLYCKLVKREISEAMGKSLEEDRECAVELGVSAYIPSEYISNEMLKLDMYRRVASINSLDRAKKVRSEFIDRFGTPPQEVEDLLWSALLGAFAKKAMIGSVIRKAKVFELKFSEDAEGRLDISKAIRLCAANAKWAQFRKSNPPAILCDINVKKLYIEILHLMEQISHCIT